MSSTTIHKFIIGSAGCATLLDSIRETPAQDLIANATPDKSAAVPYGNDTPAVWCHGLVDVQKIWLPVELCSGVLVPLGAVT